MDSMPKRTKKISLFLLIVIVLFVIALIFTIINIFSSTSALSDSEAEDTNKNFSIQLSLDSNQVSNTEEDDKHNIIRDLEGFADISSNNFNEEPSSFNLNNHTFKFDDSVEASIVDDSNKSALQILNSSSDSKIILNTDDSINYETLKSTPSLKNYLETKYNISITSDVKSGKIQNLNIILFTISDNDGVAYFVITPLNDSEIIYSKIYNKSDMSTLINDLSKPIDEISSIISNSIN